jgi:predicted transcriptional regulator
MMNSIECDRKAEIQTLHDFFGKHPMYQKTLAQLLGVSQSAVEKWSSGDRPLTQRTLNQLNTLHERFTQNLEVRERYVRILEKAS